MPVNPYVRLQKTAKEFTDKVRNRGKVEAFRYSNIVVQTSLSGGLELKQAVLTAQRLGYAMELSVQGNDLVFTYVKNLPSIPWEIS